MSHLLRQQAILILVASLMFVLNLGTAAVFNQTEAIDASCAAEMLRQSGWLIPTFNGSLLVDEPILSFWCRLVSYRLWGITEFAGRISAAIFSIVTVLLTYHLGRLLYTSSIGFRAGLVLTTCVLFGAYSRAATADAAFVFFVTLAFAAYVWSVARSRRGHFNGLWTADVSSPAVEVPERDQAASVVKARPIEVQRLVPARRWFAIPIYAAMGFAVLTYGVSGFVLPILSLILFLLVQIRAEAIEAGMLISPSGSWWRRGVIAAMQLFRRRQIIDAIQGLYLPVGLGVVLAMTLPWTVAIGVSTHGTWLRDYGNQSIEQLVGVQGWQHGFPFYQLYYAVVLHAGCFPWSVLLLVALYQLGLRLSDPAALWRSSDRFVLCWIIVWFVVDSLISIKHANYLLPIFPAVALVIARYLCEWERDDVDVGVYSFRICCQALIVSGAILLVSIEVAAYLYFPQGQWLALIGVVTILGGVTAIRFLDHELRHRVVQSLFAVALLCELLLMPLAPPSIRPNQDSPLFIAEARRVARTADIQLATYDYFEPSLVFYAGATIRQLDSPRQVADFLAGHPASFVITRASKHNELRDELRGDVVELSRHRNFLGREELILLGRN